jgi:adenylate kinase family enzyme
VQRRIAVKGSSGSGKSTLATQLAQRLDITYIELDALHHGPNWSEPTVEEFCARVQRAMESNPGRWVIDGNYERKLGYLVTDAADTVVWLDLPLPVLVWRLLRRTWHRINGRVELWSGNRETWRDVLFTPNGLIPWTMRSYFRHRREWPRRFASHPGFVRLRSTRQAQAWLARQS